MASFVQKKGKKGVQNSLYDCPAFKKIIELNAS